MPVIAAKGDRKRLPIANYVKSTFD